MTKPGKKKKTKANLAGDFQQLDPLEGNEVSQKTEVRLLYDNMRYI